MGLFYRAVRGLLDWGLRAFFRQVEVHGLENVPPEGPCLILANHHNGMIDPILLVAASPRPVSFVAKESLFRIPLLGRVLRGLRCVPAWRPQDEGYAREKNQALFDAAARAMAEGLALGIFPEGRSHLDPELLEFKHGASRIAFDAAARGLPVRVLPVGIHFEQTRGFRSKALVQFGPAMGLEDRLGRYAADPRAAMVEFTEELRRRLSEWVLTGDLADVAGGGGDLKSSFDRKKALLEGFRRLRERDPRRAESLARAMRQYRGFLERLGMRDREVAADYRAGKVLAYALRNTLILGAGLPFLAAGVAGNFVPYFVSWGVGMLGRSADVRASAAFLVGTAAFPAWWLALGFLAWRAWGPVWAAAVLAAAPVSGAIALRWMDRWHRVWRDTGGLSRALFLPRLRARLRRLRDHVSTKSRRDNLNMVS
jgi:1-acyl-sn-glycerol-3-phosphate acyltransferase